MPSKTWIEPEKRAYGVKGATFKRRARAICDSDGKLRIIHCSIPDTFFSIPAWVRIKGERLKGYLYMEDGEFHFRGYK